MQSCTQLAVQGEALCGSLASDYAVVASTSGSLSFFHLNGSSIPRHLLMYENPVPFTRIKCNSDDNIATLRADGTLSLWQPFSSLVRPLLGVLSSPTSSSTDGMMKDMDFCSANTNVIAGACQSGVVQLYDTRAPFSLQHTLSDHGGSKSTGRECLNVVFSSSAFILASCNEDRVLVWDLRRGNSPSRASGNTPILCIDVDTAGVEGGSVSFQNCIWDGCNSIMTLTSCYEKKESGQEVRSLQWWNAQTGELDATRFIPAEREPKFSEVVPPIMLSVPSGRGVIMSQQSRWEADSALKASEENVVHQISPLMHSSDGNSPVHMLSLQQKLRGMNSKSASDTASTSSLTLYGFPRPESSLSSLFLPPPKANNTDVERKSDSGPCAQLCQAPDQRSILEGNVNTESKFLSMKWGPPNRLVHSLQGGYELIALSVTSNSSSNVCSLHAYSLSSDALDKFSVDGDVGHGKLEVPSRNRGRYNKHYTISSKQTVHRNRPSSTAPIISVNPPKYSISGLHRGAVRPSSIAKKHDKMDEPELPDPRKDKSTLRSTSSPHEQRLGFWDQIQSEVLVLEEALQKDHLTGLTLGRIDQYARQISLEVTRSRSDVTASLVRPDLDTPLTALLIISFPQNFPSTKLFPTFTVRSLYNASAGSSVDNPDESMLEAQNSMMISLEAELAEVAKSALLHSSKFAASLKADGASSSGFLLDVARCFRNRVQQVWCEIYSGSNNAPETGDDDGKTMEDEKKDDAKGKDAGKVKTDGGHQNTGGSDNRESVIDARAYRICNPVCSGGIFSCTGSLSLFGGSTIQLCEVPSECISKPAKVSSATDDTTSEIGNDGLRNELLPPNENGSDAIPSPMKSKKKSTALNTRSFELPFFTPFKNSTSRESNMGSKKFSTTSGSSGRPKTYADLLLQQREIKTAYNAASRRERRRLKAMFEQSEKVKSRRRKTSNAGERNANPHSIDKGSDTMGMRSRNFGNSHTLSQFFGEDVNATDEGLEIGEAVSQDDTSSEVDMNEDDSRGNGSSLESSNVDSDSDEDYDERPNSMNVNLDTFNVATSKRHNYFNTTLDEIGAKLDLTQEDDEDDEEDDDDDYEESIRPTSIRKRHLDDSLSVKSVANARPSTKQVMMKSFASLNPFSVRVCLFICGEKRFKLAKEYTFRFFRSKISRGSMQPHRSPLEIARERQHSNSDPDMQIKANALLPNRLRITNHPPFAANMGKRVASMNNLSGSVYHTPPRSLANVNEPGEEKIFKNRQHVQQSKSFEEDNIHSRVTRKNDSAYSFSMFSSSYYSDDDHQEDVNQNHAIGGISLDADFMSQACATHADLAKAFQDNQLAHIWHLLSVSLQIMSITKFELRFHMDGIISPNEEHKSNLNSFPEKKRDSLNERIVRRGQRPNYLSLTSPASKQSLESCRIMVSCGVSKDWTVHSLGRPLFNRIFTHLRRVGDLQTLATLICTVGGPQVMAAMLGDNTLFTSYTMDKFLIRYADILHRWQCHVHATEISKFVTLDAISMPNMKGNDSLLPFSKFDSSAREVISDPLYNNESGVLLSSAFNFQVRCNQCNEPVNDQFWCTNCDCYAFRCSICEQILRGLGFFCPVCGHGGHGDHIKQWFGSSPNCPVGCGCRCAAHDFTTFSSTNTGDILKSHALEGIRDVNGNFSMIADEKGPRDDGDSATTHSLSGTSYLVDRSSVGGSVSTKGSMSENNNDELHGESLADSFESNAIFQDNDLYTH